MQQEAVDQISTEETKGSPIKNIVFLVLLILAGLVSAVIGVFLLKSLIGLLAGLWPVGVAGGLVGGAQ